MAGKVISGNAGILVVPALRESAESIAFVNFIRQFDDAYTDIDGFIREHKYEERLKLCKEVEANDNQMDELYYKLSKGDQKKYAEQYEALERKFYNAYVSLMLDPDTKAKDADSVAVLTSSVAAAALSSSSPEPE